MPYPLVKQDIDLVSIWVPESIANNIHDEEPLVMVPVAQDHYALRLVMEDVLADFGLPNDCVLEYFNPCGCLTQYGFVLPLSLAMIAARRYLGET